MHCRTSYSSCTSWPILRLPSELVVCQLFLAQYIYIYNHIPSTTYSAWCKVVWHATNQWITFKNMLATNNAYNGAALRTSVASIANAFATIIRSAITSGCAMENTVKVGTLLKFCSAPQTNNCLKWMPFGFPVPSNPQRLSKNIRKHQKGSIFRIPRKLSFRCCGGGGFLICIWSVAKLIHRSFVDPDGVAGEAQWKQIRTILRAWKWCIPLGYTNVTMKNHRFLMGELSMDGHVQ